jgi:hypothetical protein
MIAAVGGVGISAVSAHPDPHGGLNIEVLIVPALGTAHA